LAIVQVDDAMFGLACFLMSIFAAVPFIIYLSGLCTFKYGMWTYPHGLCLPLVDFFVFGIGVEIETLNAFFSRLYHVRQSRSRNSYLTNSVPRSQICYENSAVLALRLPVLPRLYPRVITHPGLGVAISAPLHSGVCFEGRLKLTSMSLILSASHPRCSNSS
jgi:hypothetical protein